MYSNTRQVLGTKDINIIIDIWKDHIHEFKGVHRNIHVYANMCEEAATHYGIKLTTTEMRTRLNNLKKRYRAEKLKATISEGSPSKWTYYNQVHSILDQSTINHKKPTDESSVSHQLCSMPIIRTSITSQLTPSLTSSLSRSSFSDSLPGPSSAKMSKINTESLDDNRSSPPNFDKIESYTSFVESDATPLKCEEDPFHINKSAVTSNIRSTFDIYGECVAAQLKELPLNEAYTTMAELQALLTRSRIKTMRHSDSI